MGNALLYGGILGLFPKPFAPRWHDPVLSKLRGFSNIAAALSRDVFRGLLCNASARYTAYRNSVAPRVSEEIVQHTLRTARVQSALEHIQIFAGNSLDCARPFWNGFLSRRTDCDTWASSILYSIATHQTRRRTEDIEGSYTLHYSANTQMARGPA